MKQEDQNIMVSVRLMVYNNERFIRKAMDSIMMQKTTFPVELVVGDDFSSDNTLELIKPYQNTEKITIRILERPKGGHYWLKRKKKNASVRTNFLDIVENCRGKYIALLDGDDYWIDPLKLQKQVDVLETNQQLVACHHWQKLAVKKQNGYEEIEAPKKGHGYYPYEADVKAIFENKMRIKTRTVMFRNILNTSEITLNFSKAVFTDVPLSFVLGKYGRFGFIDEEMAVYRETDSGVSKNGLKELGLNRFTIQHFKNLIEIWDYADKFYNYKYHKESTITILAFYKRIFAHLPVTIVSFFKVIYFDLFRRKVPIYYKIFSIKWIVFYYSKKFKSKLKQKMKPS